MLKFFMMKRPIVTIASDKELALLRRRAPRVSDFRTWLTNLAADMVETMRDAGGVGLSAPQIGQSTRLVVVRTDPKVIAFANPEILQASDDIVTATEACLSIPGYLGLDVPRARRIQVRAQNLRGVRVQFWAEDFFARVLQHEIDHLNGVLYTDRIPQENLRRASASLTTSNAPQVEAPTEISL